MLILVATTVVPKLLPSTNLKNHQVTDTQYRQERKRDSQREGKPSASETQNAETKTTPQLDGRQSAKLRLSELWQCQYPNNSVQNSVSSEQWHEPQHLNSSTYR